ncbi:MAG: hypothetical protein K2X01_07410 [Cyanobacteria bacterium]|nr:hypothetical protein [Cyanobacteriota bacterium]
MSTSMSVSLPRVRFNAAFSGASLVNPRKYSLPQPPAGQVFTPSAFSQNAKVLAPQLRFGAEAIPVLLQRYSIDPAQVTLRVTSPHLNPTQIAEIERDKAQHIGKVLQTYEHGLKNQAVGNFSLRYYNSGFEMANGTFGLGTNIEHTRDNIFCGERSAMTNAFNQALDRMDVPTVQAAVQDPAKKEGLVQGMKVTRMYSSSYKPVGTDRSAMEYCADCQGWMTTQTYFSPETQVFSLEKDPQSGAFALRVETLADYLPFWGKQQPSLTTQPSVLGLPVNVSAKAQVALAAKGLQTRQLAQLMAEAQVAYLGNKTSGYAELSKKPLGAAVLVRDGQGNLESTSSERMDWSRRWPLDADLGTAYIGLVSAAKKGGAQPPQLQALAYYGDDNVPHIPNLGRLSQDRGGVDTLVVVIENETLQVRTIQDYMTYIYTSSKDLSGKKAFAVAGGNATGSGTSTSGTTP